MIMLAIALISAKLLARVFEKFSLPGVLGELLAGFALAFWGAGAQAFAGTTDESRLIHGLAEIGLLILLFQIGLETRLKDFLETSWDSSRVAVVGVIAPFALTIAMFFLLPSLRDSRP